MARSSTSDKALFIIDFSIDKDELMKVKLTSIVSMLTDLLPEKGRLSVVKIIAQFNGVVRSSKESIARRAIESLLDSFVADIDSTNESINDFIRTHPYAFDGGYERASLRLNKYVDRSKARWTELISYLGLNKK